MNYKQFTEEDYENLGSYSGEKGFSGEFFETSQNRKLTIIYPKCLGPFEKNRIMIQGYHEIVSDNQCFEIFMFFGGDWKGVIRKIQDEAIKQGIREAKMELRNWINS